MMESKTANKFMLWGAVAIICGIIFGYLGSFLLSLIMHTFNASNQMIYRVSGTILTSVCPLLILLGAIVFFFGFFQHEGLQKKLFWICFGISLPTIPPVGFAVLSPITALLNNIPPGSEWGDKARVVAILYALSWIALLAYPMKKLFFEQRERRWWHYLLGIIIVQIIIAVMVFALFAAIFANLSIGF